MLKSHKTGHPSRPANFFGPSAGRFREVSLYIYFLPGPSWVHTITLQFCSYIIVDVRVRIGSQYPVFIVTGDYMLSNETARDEILSRQM